VPLRPRSSPGPRNTAVHIATGALLLFAISLGATGASAATTDGAAPAPATASAAKTKKKPAPRAKRRTRKRPAATPAAARVVPASAPKIVPFPTDGAAVAKAFADHRREQLAGVESVARAAKQDDRWRSVLFELRDFDSRADPEACFWRVLAYYRLGEVRRARSLRQDCDLALPDRRTLDGEDAAAASLQPAQPVAELRAAHDPEPDEPSVEAAGVGNPAPYAGPAPARWKQP
jgi:hypothetical protein